MHIVIDARIRRSSTGRYVDRLLEHLQSVDLKNTYTVLVEPEDDWKPIVKNFQSEQCDYSQFSFSPSQQLGFTRQLYRLKPDLVHFTMPQRPLFYSGRTVVTVHDLTILRFPRKKKESGFTHSIKQRLYKKLLKFSLKKALAVIVPTEFVKQDVIKLHNFTRDKVVVTLEASEPPLKIKSKALKGVKRPFIMHVGSPFPHKNIERLIDAFELLKAEQPDLQLVLAGKKEYFFERLIANKISKSRFKKDIITPGFIEDAELKWLYENASAYVLPSLSEGFGLPGLEAMAHGTPVASSDATCLPEVYGDAALYFDPLDTQSIAVVVNEILTDSKLSNKLRTLGHKQVDLYSWQKMAKQTLDIYNKVLQEPRTRGNF